LTNILSIAVKCRNTYLLSPDFIFIINGIVIFTLSTLGTMLDYAMIFTSTNLESLKKKDLGLLLIGWVLVLN
jgi:hypothetical protein